MDPHRLAAWLRWLRATATFVFIAAMCVAVALLAIAFVPGSPVTQVLPASAVNGLHLVGGVTTGVAVDTSGQIPFTVHDASLTQRLLHLMVTLPGVVLVAEIARRLATLLRIAQVGDPFTEVTVRALWRLGKLTAFAGVGVWALGQVAQGLLSATMLDAHTSYKPHQSPLGWLAVGLIFAGLSVILDRGVAMRAELDTVI